MRRTALIALLILASCAGDGQTTEPPPPAPTLTTLADAELPQTSTAAPVTTIAPTTTTTPVTTTLPADAAADFGLTQVVFGDSAFVVITNWGNDSGTLRDHWLSQGDAFQALPDIALAPGEQALIGLAEIAPPELTGMAAVVDLGRAIGPVALDSGEVGLHHSSSFDDPASLVAYVAWGAGSHARAELATAADLWDQGFVAVFDNAQSISSGVHPAVSSLDWSVDIGG
jgi:hypothetical protein